MQESGPELLELMSFWVYQAHWAIAHVRKFTASSHHCSRRTTDTNRTGRYREYARNRGSHQARVRVVFRRQLTDSPEPSRDYFYFEEVFRAAL
jgi:GrpB-like predicted nucleotidyltransferase (UPF0157 family)